MLDDMTDMMALQACLPLGPLARLHSLLQTAEACRSTSTQLDLAWAVALPWGRGVVPDRSRVEGGRVKKTKGKRGEGSSERLCGVIGKPL